MNINKEKKFASIFRTSANKGENKENESQKDRENRASRVASIFDEKSMKTLGKRLTYGRKINVVNEFFVEKQSQLKNFSLSINCNKDKETDHSSSTSQDFKKVKKNSPTHQSIPYEKRKDEDFKKNIIRKFKNDKLEILNEKNFTVDECTAPNSHRTHEKFNKRIKRSSDKKMSISNFKLEYQDIRKQKTEIKIKQCTLYKDSEVNFNEEWQEFIINHVKLYVIFR